MPEIVVDRDYLVETLVEMVGIDSTNPSLVPGGAGEAAIAAAIGVRMRGLGLEVAVHEAQPGRPSVVGTLRGAGGGRSLMLNGHLDTVGVEGLRDPFRAEVRDGRLYGRGSYDMKGSLAACLAALKALVDAGARPRGDVLLAAVADEEYASLGTMDVLRRHRTDAAVVTEATGMKVGLAHKGFVWLEVETLGRAAHGSRFDEGIDANLRMGRYLHELETLERDLRARTPHPLVGPPSLHAARLEGGTELSMYAARCKLQIERRTVPGETQTHAAAEAQAILDRLAAADPTFRGDVRVLLERSPFEVAPDAGIVRALRAAATRVLGVTPTDYGQAWWTDAALLAAAGIETVMIGPIGGGAHSLEEWVDLQSLHDLALVLAHTARDYCGWYRLRPEGRSAGRARLRPSRGPPALHAGTGAQGPLSVSARLRATRRHWCVGAALRLGPAPCYTPASVRRGRSPSRPGSVHERSVAESRPYGTLDGVSARTEPRPPGVAAADDRVAKTPIYIRESPR